MLAFFFVILIVPLLVAGVAFVVFNGITWKEFGVIGAACLFIATISACAVSCSSISDTEAWNGYVVGKQQNIVSCSHSYRCMCVNVCSSDGKNTTCTEVCQTCYEHSHDYDWDVYTSINETITIDRVDRQGVHEPPRFTSVVIGEPITTLHSYDNYIKASPDSLFRHQGLTEKYAAQLPEYPQEIYDYYRLDRLVTLNVNVDQRAWNKSISQINAVLGAKKQVNIVVVLVKNKPREWYYALEEKWLGGKKNDLVLVIDVDSTLKPQWVEVMAWTTNQMVKVKLRDDVMDLPRLDHNAIMQVLSVDVDKFYARKHMKEFEYLKSSITPSGTEWFITLVIALIVSIALTYFMQKNDVFGDEERLIFRKFWQY